MNIDLSLITRRKYELRGLKCDKKYRLLDYFRLRRYIKWILVQLLVRFVKSIKII